MSIMKIKNKRERRVFLEWYNSIPNELKKESNCYRSNDSIQIHTELTKLIKAQKHNIYQRSINKHKKNCIISS